MAGVVEKIQQLPENIPQSSAGLAGQHRIFWEVFHNQARLVLGAWWAAERTKQLVIFHGDFRWKSWDLVGVIGIKWDLYVCKYIIVNKEMLSGNLLLTKPWPI